jgi:GTPase SAR1 family protein
MVASSSSSNSKHDDEKDSSPPPRLWQTTVRQRITPYLPPPVVVAMRQMDPHLEPYMGGPEPSMTLMGTLCLVVFLWHCQTWQWRRRRTNKATNGNGGAIQDETNDDELAASDQPYDATVLLCGPPLAGKTCLFYQLLQSPSSTPQQQQHNSSTTSSTSICTRTVSSIKATTGFLVETSATTTTNKNTKGKRATIWRYLDTPGHWGASKLVSTVVEQESIDRLVLVLDSTQPVSKAADYLYALLLHQQQQQHQKSKAQSSIVVACHKSKHLKAKNVRRLKLQLRNELERLSKLDTTTTNTTTTTTTDWDDVLNNRVGFITTSVDPPLLDELQAFLSTGK